MKTPKWKTFYRDIKIGIPTTTVVVTLKVFIVDGGVVKLENPPFCEGGNFKRYSFIPDGEIWIDGNIFKSQWNAILVHELHEAAWMLFGYQYSEAHPIAEIIETMFRQLSPTKQQAFLDKIHYEDV